MTVMYSKSTLHAFLSDMPNILIYLMLLLICECKKMYQVNKQILHYSSLQPYCFGHRKNVSAHFSIVSKSLSIF